MKSPTIYLASWYSFSYLCVGHDNAKVHMRSAEISTVLGGWGSLTVDLHDVQTVQKWTWTLLAQARVYGYFSLCTLN